MRTTFLYRPDRGHRGILSLAALVLAMALSISAVPLSAALADEAPGPVEVPPAAQEAASPEAPAPQTSPPAEAMPVQEPAPQAPTNPFLVRGDQAGAELATPLRGA